MIGGMLKSIKMIDIETLNKNKDFPTNVEVEEEKIEVKEKSAETSKKHYKKKSANSKVQDALDHKNNYTDSEGKTYEEYLNLKEPFNMFEIEVLKNYENKHKDNLFIGLFKIISTMAAFTTVSFFIVYLIDNAVIFSLYTVNCDFIVFTELGFFKKLDMVYIEEEWVKLLVGTLIMTLLFSCLNIKNIILSGIKFPIEVKDRVLFGVRKNWITSPIFTNMASLTIIQVILSIIISGFITSMYVGDMGCIFYKSPHYVDYIRARESANILKERQEQIAAVTDEKARAALEQELNNSVSNIISYDNIVNNNNNNKAIKSGAATKQDFEEAKKEIENRIAYNRITSLTNLELQKEQKSTTVYLQLFILVMLLFPTPSSMLLTVKKIYTGITQALLEGIKTAIEKGNKKG